MQVFILWCLRNTYTPPSTGANHRRSVSTSKERQDLKTETGKGGIDEEEGEERYDDKQGFAECCIVRALWGSERRVNKHKRKDVYI